jgi:hypothetical protein
MFVLHERKFVVLVGRKDRDVRKSLFAVTSLWTKRQNERVSELHAGRRKKRCQAGSPLTLTFMDAVFPNTA